MACKRCSASASNPCTLFAFVIFCQLETVHRVRKGKPTTYKRKKPQTTAWMQSFVAIFMIHSGKSLGQGRQLVSLIFVDEWVDYHVQVTLQKFIKFIQGQVDSVIGNPALGKIVGAYSL